jgi:predicted RecA/RadA family phage recombinase
MAADEAVMWQGEYEAIDYVAGADIAGGEVVLLGNTAGVTCGIAHHPIANGETGSLASGGAVFEVSNLNNAANYAKVYWDDSVNKITTVSTNNAFFGWIVNGGAGGANTKCKALHWPRLTA